MVITKMEFQELINILFNFIDVKKKKNKLQKEKWISLENKYGIQYCNGFNECLNQLFELLEEI